MSFVFLISCLSFSLSAQSFHSFCFVFVQWILYMSFNRFAFLHSVGGWNVETAINIYNSCRMDNGLWCHIRSKRLAYPKMSSSICILKWVCHNQTTQSLILLWVNLFYHFVFFFFFCWKYSKTNNFEQVPVVVGVYSKY